MYCWTCLTYRSPVNGIDGILVVDNYPPWLKSCPRLEGCPTLEGSPRLGDNPCRVLVGRGHRHFEDDEGRRYVLVLDDEGRAKCPHCGEELGPREDPGEITFTQVGNGPEEA
jgi:hypothetical protein